MQHSTISLPNGPEKRTMYVKFFLYNQMASGDVCPWYIVYPTGQIRALIISTKFYTF